MLEYTANISIDEDHLNFDAILSCTIELHEDNLYSGIRTAETYQWLIASFCQGLISEIVNPSNLSVIVAEQEAMSH